MRTNILIAVLLSSVAFAAAAESPKGAHKKATAQAGDAAEGKSTYQMVCAGCHDGAAAGPPLKGLFKHKTMADKKHSALTETNIRIRITKGGEAMPPFGSLKTKQLDDLIAYLKTL